MSDAPSHRTVTAPPRAAVTAILLPDGSLRPTPALAPAPDPDGVRPDPSREGRGEEAGASTPSDEEKV